MQLSIMLSLRTKTVAFLYLNKKEAEKWRAAANKYQRFRNKVREMNQETSVTNFMKYSNPELALRAYYFLAVYDDQEGFNSINIAVSIIENKKPLPAAVRTVLKELEDENLVICIGSKYKMA